MLASEAPTSKSPLFDVESLRAHSRELVMIHGGQRSQAGVVYWHSVRVLVRDKLNVFNAEFGASRRVERLDSALVIDVHLLARYHHR